MPARLVHVVALAAALSLVFAGCVQEDDGDVAATPTATPELELIGQFQLTAEVDAAAEDETPGHPLPDVLPEVSPTPDGDEGVGQDREPDAPGRLTVELRTFNDPLEDECGVDRGDSVDVFWTVDTRFAPPAVLDRDLPDDLEGRQASIGGWILTSGDEAAPTPAAGETPTPGVTPTPGESPEATTEDCVLVAANVNVVQADAPDTEATPTPDGPTPSPTPTPATPSPAVRTPTPVPQS